MLRTTSEMGLEFFSSLEFGFPRAHYLQSTVWKISYTIDWRLWVLGKPNSNEEKNSNPTSEAVYGDNMDLNRLKDLGIFITEPLHLIKTRLLLLNYNDPIKNLGHLWLGYIRIMLTSWTLTTECSPNQFWRALK